jgi:hypothetical protein
MSTDASAVVLILPNDDINSIIGKVRDVGTSDVQILVPDGITLLQSPKECTTLQQAGKAAGIGLMIISSDEQTLATAKKSAIATIAVQGARVMLPSESEMGEGAVGIQESKPIAAASATPAPAQKAAAPEGYDDYDDFAAELDSLGDVMSGESLPEGYDDFAAELDNLGDMMSGQTPAAGGSSTYNDPFADELDNLGDIMSGQTPAAGGASATSRPAPPPRRRIRPEDIELSETEKDRAASVRPGGGRRQDDDKKSKKKKKASSRSTSPSLREMREEQAAAKKRGGFGLPLPLPIIAAIVVLFVVFIGVIVLWRSKVTVTVALPVQQTSEIAFHAVPVMVAHVGEQPSGIAVQAESLSAVVTITETGTVEGEIMSPGTTARGTISLLNEGDQAFYLPIGTEFVALNTAGQEVSFVSEADVTVEGATTSRVGNQRITTFGQASVPIVARAPGSNSNVAANTIIRMALPGQPAFAINQGTLFVEHGAIEGGSEQPVRIVKDEDVQALLGAALTSLDNQSRQQLTTIAQGRGLELQPTTMYPSSAELSQGQGYQLQSQPSVGGAVADPNNPTFALSVSAQFNALATPAGAPLQQQLQTIMPEQLQQSGMLTAGLGLQPNVTNWQWNGMSLLVDGVLRPVQVGNDLSPQMRAKIRSALKGKSRAEAQQQLEQLKKDGVISGYMLPNTSKIPSLDFLLTLDVVKPNN